MMNPNNDTNAGSQLPSFVLDHRLRWTSLCIGLLLTVTSLRYNLRMSSVFDDFQSKMDTDVDHSIASSDVEEPKPSSSLRAGSSSDPNANKNDPFNPPPILDQVKQCRFFLAESALPKAGLGVFTAIPIPEGEPTHPAPDICIYVADNPPYQTQLDSHTWQDWRFHDSFDGGKNPRAACEGITTLYNEPTNGLHTSTPQTTMSALDDKYNKLTNFVPTNGGLYRQTHPGAGAITQHYGITSRAERDVSAGSEITIGGGKATKKDIEEKAPRREIEYLWTHGMCVDHIEIRPHATDPQMGRGGFARRSLVKDTSVSPLPLQIYQRADFQKQDPEEILLNYSFQFQPKGNKDDDGYKDRDGLEYDIILFPYADGAGLINHSHDNPNVALRWSTHHMNHIQWLDLPNISTLLDMAYQGSLLLDLYALRDIEEGEELFLDYGPEWDAAWKEHVKNWLPPSKKDDKTEYVYPQDMQLENLRKPYRTVDEQEADPYPDNLMTVCNTRHHNYKKHNKGNDDDDNDDESVRQWKAPNDTPSDFQDMVYCHILDRRKVNENEDDGNMDYLYRVALQFGKEKGDAVFDPSLNSVNVDVPHSQISWVDKPNRSDMHLQGVFRHPIGLPRELIPPKWRGSIR